MAKFKRLVKGSPEAKRYMAKLRKLAVAKRKSGPKKNPVKGYGRANWQHHPAGGVIAYSGEPGRVFATYRGKVTGPYASKQAAFDLLTNTWDKAAGKFVATPKLLTPSQVKVTVWEERDRLHIAIVDRATEQKTIAEWWDDAAREMFNDGYFKTTGPRMRGLEDSVIKYALEMGLLTKANPSIMIRKRAGGLKTVRSFGTAYAYPSKGEGELVMTGRRPDDTFRTEGGLDMVKVAGLNPGYSGVLSSAFYKAIGSMPNEALRTHHKGLLRNIDLDPMNPKVRLWTQQAGAISHEMKQRGVRANPLSKAESRKILKLAAGRVRYAASTAGNANLSRMRSEASGYASGLADAVQIAGPKDHRRHASKIVDSARAVIRGDEKPKSGLFRRPIRMFNNPLLMTVMGNPSSLKAGDKQIIRNIVSRLSVGLTEEDAIQAVLDKIRTRLTPSKLEAVRLFTAKVHRENQGLAGGVARGSFLPRHGTAIKQVSVFPVFVDKNGQVTVVHSLKEATDISVYHEMSDGLVKWVHDIPGNSPPAAVRAINYGAAEARKHGVKLVTWKSLRASRNPSYRCNPEICSNPGHTHGNPFEVHHGRGRDLVVQADPSARGMKTRFKTREEAERVFGEIGASEDQGYRVVEVDRSGRPISPKRNPVEGWAVTKDGETLKTFPDAKDDFPAAKFLLNHQGQSVDWAVRHEGYDIVLVRGGKVVYSYRQALSKRMDPRRNPAPGESQWAFIPRTKRGLYIPAFEGTYEEALTAAKMYAARHKVETELWETDPANFRMQAWLKRLRATIRPHGGWELARKNPPASPTRWVKLARFDSESDYRKVELDLAAIGISVSYMDDWVYVRVFNFKNAADYLRKLKPKGQVRRTPRSNPSQADIVKAATSAGYTPADAAKVAAEFSSTGRLPFTIRRFFSNPSGPRATGTGRPRGYLVGGRKRTKTLEEAKALAKRIFEKTGSIVSIEEWPKKNPKANPSNQGVKRKVTMSLEAFARLVKAKNDPKLWAAFTKKVNDYKKWTHGTLPKKVTVETVNVPGMNGMWITYDAGKSPETTYIMPKGSKRKGAWKHEWNSMPDLKNDPAAGIVLTKLKGRSKITDFYHR